MEHDMHMEDGAARQLDAIHAGGRHLLVVIRQQIAKALDKMEDGEFSLALDHLTTASAMLSSLATAKQYIAIADGSRLVRAVDLEEGQELTNIGEITEVKIESCPSCRHHIDVKVGEHELRFHGEQEVYVVAQAHD